MLPQLSPTRDFFISHAGEDKDSFARPLAYALTDAGIEVWFDEFELSPGQSLRRSLDRGLASSRLGVVILSSAFFGKKWPEYELNGMTQLFDEERLIPIWHGVGPHEVRRYSASLADIVAIPSAKGLNHAVAELKRIATSRSMHASQRTVPLPSSRPSATLNTGETPSETVARAHALLKAGRATSNTLIIAVACAPHQEALRPKEFGDPVLRSALLREAIFGADPIFDAGQGNSERIMADQIVLEQADRRVVCDAEGSVAIVMPAVPRRSGIGDGLPSLIIEEVEERIESGLGFIANLLDRLDPTRLWTEVAVSVALLGCQHLGWRTRADAQRSPNRLSLNPRSGDALVDARPARRPRQQLIERGRELADDVTELLGRRLTSI